MKLIPRRNTNNDLAFRNDFDEIVHRFFNDWPLSQMSRLSAVQDFVPQVNISETEKGYKLTAELPGLEEKDFEVFIEDNLLTLRGEKKEEHREDNENVHTFESSYGSFQRSFRLPEGVDSENVDAKFKNGLLTVHLKKDQQKSKRKKIDIA